MCRLQNQPTFALACVAQLVRVSSHKLKAYGFNSRSEYIPRLLVQPPVGATTRGNGLMGLSLSLSLPSPLSKVNKHVFR